VNIAARLEELVDADGIRARGPEQPTDHPSIANNSTTAEPGVHREHRARTAARSGRSSRA
jgi:hypothetical protein